MDRAKYPLKDEQGNLIVKNLFKMDKQSIVFFIIVLALIGFYLNATKECKEFYEEPKETCLKLFEKNKIVCDIYDETEQFRNIVKNSDDIIKLAINVSKLPIDNGTG